MTETYDSPSTQPPENGTIPEGPPPVALLWDLRAELGEGPVWSGEDSCLYFVDILGRAIHCYAPETGQTFSWAAPARPCFLAPLEGGGLLCGLENGLSRFDPETGAFDPVTGVEEDKPGTRLNDGHVDVTGRLWFGSMDDAETSPLGSLYSLDATSGPTPRHHHDGYTVSNGPAVSPDGRILYHCDSAQGIIYAFDVADDGTLGGRRVFQTVSDGAPDGLAMDSEGTLWVGIWGGGRIERFRPDGTALPAIPVPARNVTKVAFGGSDGRTVFITTARKGLSEAELAAEPTTGGLFCLRTAAPGVSQPAFVLPE